MQTWRQKFDLQKIEKLAPILFFLILVWLAWRLASLVWWFVVPAQPPVVSTVALGSQQKMMPDIVRFSLFEEQATQPQAQANLPIKLEGVMLANPRHFSSAVIRVNEVALSYRIGETINETSLTVADVFWDRITVREQNGQTREVFFVDQSMITNPSNPDPSPPPQARNSTQDALGGAIEGLQQNRDEYLSQMGLASGGNGFEISERTPPALRARLGLKPGDTITSINGQPLSGGMNEAQLLEQIRKTGQAKIEIQRGGQTLTIQQSF